MNTVFICLNVLELSFYISHLLSHVAIQQIALSRLSLKLVHNGMLWHGPYVLSVPIPRLRKSIRRPSRAILHLTSLNSDCDKPRNCTKSSSYISQKVVDLPFLHLQVYVWSCQSVQILVPGTLSSVQVDLYLTQSLKSIQIP